MNVMKKVLSLVLCMLLVTAMFAGCAKKEESTGDTGTKETTTKEGSSQSEDKEEMTSDKPVEINMFISMPEYADAITELIEAYKEVKPNVTINYETTQNDYPTLLKAKLNSGDIPDLFSSTSGKEIGVYLDYSQNLSDRALASAMSDSVKAVMMSGDELHGISVKDNLFGIVYNKAIFDEVGITEFPQTFSELEAACVVIEAAGYTPFTSGFAEWWVYKHIFQHFMYSAQPDDVEGLVKGFISGEAHFVDYPELYNDFFNFIDLVIKYGDQKPLEADLSTEISSFGSSKASMVIGQGPWVEGDILKIDPNIMIGFDGYPTNEDASLTKVIAGSDQAIRINKDSEVLNEVLDFIDWWYTSEYGQSWFSDVAGVIPPIKGAVVPDYEIVKQGSALATSEGAGTLGVVYSTDSFHQAFGEIMQAYVAGVADKDATCEQIEIKWVELEGGQ